MQNLGNGERDRPNRLLDSKVSRQLVESDVRQTTREMLRKLSVCHATVISGLRKIGKVKKLDGGTAKTNKLNNPLIASSYIQYQ